jgi:nitrite reductase/ring-hydroxylating ferredoxin subunit
MYDRAGRFDHRAAHLSRGRGDERMVRQQRGPMFHEFQGVVMSLLKTLIMGRPDGIRAKLLGRKAPAAPGSSPGSSSSRSAAPPAAPEPAEKALGLRKEAPKDVTPPDGFEVVLHKDSLDDGQIIEVIIGGSAIAVARVEGEHYAISNTCPHSGGPLGDGKLKDGIVTCPYHGWKFDVRDGSCKTRSSESVKTYAVRVVGDAVCVQL